MKKRHLSDAEAAQYGFRWNQVDVTRLATGKSGDKYIGIDTDRETLMVYVTPTGFIRVGKPIKRA